MTDSTRATLALPLQGSPQRALFWLIVLAFAVPAVVIVWSFGVLLAGDAPKGPVLLAAAVALGVTAFVGFRIRRMQQRIGVALDGGALVVDTGVAVRRFPLAALRNGGFRVVDLAAHPELKPWLRTWGIGMPGLASGWFRLRNGGKALCILTSRERVSVLRADDGTWILLSLADASVLRQAMAS